MTWVQNDSYNFLDEYDELGEQEEMVIFREKGKTPYSTCAECGNVGYVEDRFCGCCGEEMQSYISHDYIRYIAKDGLNNIDMVLESKRK